jgi:hypothetical protein
MCGAHTYSILIECLTRRVHVVAGACRTLALTFINLAFGDVD